MRDPVTCAAGHSYERANIELWLASQDTSPQTGAQLPNKRLTPNHALRNLIAEVTIEGAVLSATAQSYAHDNCDVPTVKAEYRGVIEEASRQENHIDFVQRTGPFLYTLLLPEVTTYYNANIGSAGCDLGDWETGVPRDVSGKTCAPYAFPEVGSRLKDRLWVKGDRISFGHLPLSWQNEADGGFPQTSSPISFVKIED